MRRFLLIAVLCLLAALVLAGGLTAYLLHDESFLKRQLGDLAMEYTGRSLHIDGPLELTFGRVTTLEAQGVRLANPEWAQSPELFQADRLRIGIDLPSLLSWQLRLTEIVIEDCAVALERAADGRDSWTLDTEPEDPAEDSSDTLPYLVEHTTITDCRLGLRAPDGTETLDLRLDHAMLGHQDGDRVGTTARGEFNGQPLTVDGWLAPIGMLARGGRVSHELRIRAGQVQLDSTGTIEDVWEFSGIELHTRFSGPEIGTLLRNLQQPPVSEGPFDIRIDLDTQGDYTTIDVDGGLGNLEVYANGEIDRLNDASSGRLELRVAGPDLRALGEVLGVDGLVRESFSADVRVAIGNGVARFDPSILSTERDRIELSGTIALDAGRAGSAVDLRLDSGDPARWAELLQLGPGPAGAVHLESHLEVDPEGRLSIDARLSQYETQLRLRGPVGSLEHGLDATLQVELNAPQPGPLLPWLAGRELPAIPLAADGTLGITPDELRFADLRMASGPHNVRIDGLLGLGETWSRSELDFTFDSPDLAALGHALGRDDLPNAPVRLEGMVKRVGPGLEFAVSQGNLGAVRLRLQGRIADSDDPLGIDAEFELRLPGPGPVHVFLPQLDLPDVPIAVSGALHNQSDGVAIEQLQISLGETRLNAAGLVKRDERFDVWLDVSGPDSSALSRWVPTDLPAQPFALEGRFLGEPDSLEIRELEAALGEIRLRGAGLVGRDERFDVRLDVSGPDSSALSPWIPTDLPAQPFALAGHFLGAPELLEAREFEATLGDSRIEGEVSWAYGDRRRLSGRLHAPVLDLSPFVAGGEAAEPAPEPAARQFVFDDTPVMELADFLTQVEGQLTIDEFRLNAARATQIRLRVALDGRHVEFAPFSLRGMAGGLLDGSLVLDGTSGLPVLDFDVRGRGVAMAFGAYAGQDPATLPQGDVDLKLHARGRTHREMASSAKGRLRMQFGPGEIAPSSVRFLLSDFLTELLQELNPFTEAEKITRLECLVAAADAVDGKVEVNPIVVHAERLTVVSEGTINLRDETINLDFETRPRKGLGITVSDLFNPFIRVGGTLLNPTIALDPQGTVVEGGLAVATAGISILAKSLANRYLRTKNPCDKALSELEKRDGADP